MISMGIISGRAPGGGDPHWSSVVSLQNFVTDFADAKGHAWTGSGDAAVVDGVLILDGAGDFLSTPHSSDFNLPGLFTIEAWIFPGTISKQMCICSHRPSAGLHGYMFQMTAAGKLGFQYGNNNASLGNSWVNLAGATTLEIDEPMHVEAGFDGTTLRLFVNGELDGATTVFAGVRADIPTPVYVGRDRVGNAGRDWQGGIISRRVTKGVCRHTSAFTPPPMLFPT